MIKEKKLSSNDKRRRTTLRKKSVDELVNIVLRKDDVERKLQKSIETFKNLQDVNDKRINNLKDSLSKSEEIQVAQEKTIASLNATINNKNKSIETFTEHNKILYSRIKVLKNTINSRNKELRVFFIVIVVLLIMLVFSVIL